MTIRNDANKLIDFLRLPRPQGERRKSIDSPWGWGKTIDFQASCDSLLNIPDTLKKINVCQESYTRLH